MLVLIGAQVASAGDATTRPATAPGIEVQITSVRYDFVKLHTPGDSQGAGSAIFDTGSDDLKSDKKQLVVHVTIVNTGKQELVYHTFSGTDKSHPAFAFLRGNDNRTYTIVQFPGLEPVGSIQFAHVAAGQSVDDVIVFEKPAANAGPVHIVLPAQNIGGVGPVELVLAWQNS